MIANVIFCAEEEVTCFCCGEPVKTTSTLGAPHIFLLRVEVRRNETRLFVHIRIRILSVRQV